MKLYGFFYCSCTYESAYGLMSLHMTKAGAYRAMRRHKIETFDESRSVKHTRLHMEPGHWRYWRAMDALAHQGWAIKVVEVQQ